MPKERKKSLCMDTLRHAEYYGMLQTFDDLYAKSKSGEKFPNLMELILSQDNIMLAYRNIKSNTGSYTAGTDHQNIGDIGKLPPSVVIEKVRKIVTGSQHGYRPKPVRRKDIPKPNGKTRPLGIPCIWDRLIQQCINNVGFWDSIPLWAVTLIGGLLITVLSFTMILTVYGRMFSLWMYAAIAPIPLSTFAGEPTSSVGKNFIRSYAGVCLQGVVIALACIIFSAISSSPPAVDTGTSVVTAVWTYVGELAFNLLVLVGAIKGFDRIVKEIMGL